jgi:hypothetical protein
MTAAIFPFPQRRQFAIRVMREEPAWEPAWLVVRRSHGWLFADRREALAEAHQLAEQDGVGIVTNHSERRNRSMKYDDTNRGALFHASKEKVSDRDYSGSININGTEYWLSGWVKTSAAGNKYLSLAVKPKAAADTAKPNPAKETAGDIF